MLNFISVVIICALYAVVFFNTIFSCHRTETHTHIEILLALPHSLNIRAKERAKYSVWPDELAAAAVFTEYSLGVSWGCVSEMVKFIWCCSLVVTVQRLHMHIHVYVRMCVGGGYDGEPASNRTVIFEQYI